MEPKDELKCKPVLLLYRCIPIQRGSLVFRTAASSMEVRWASCCCPCAALRIELEAVPKVGRQPLCSWARLLRDAPISFLAAFLFHLIPSIIWGAEKSLGSPGNHQLMGIVWFAGWPVWFLLLQLLRPWGLHCSGTSDGLGCTGVFIPFASHSHAKAVADWWTQAAAKSRAGLPGLAPPPRSKSSPAEIACMVIGLAVVLGLIGNALGTAAAIQSCMGRGCCFDNATTLDSCSATGYPSP